MTKFITWHKNTIASIQARLGLSNYALLWIGFVKGLIIGYIIG